MAIEHEAECPSAEGLRLSQRPPHGLSTRLWLRRWLALYLTRSAHGKLNAMRGALPSPYTLTGLVDTATFEQMQVRLCRVAL